MNYVSGFLAAVKIENKQAYTDFASEMAGYFTDRGALRVVECWGDNVPDGKVTSFPMAVKKEEDEAVIFSWIEWPDRVTADKCMEEMMSGPPEGTPTDMPFDGQRIVFGGFEMIVEK